jgi:hypothetical protein
LDRELWQWAWARTSFGPFVPWLQGRKGEACTVICQGRDGKRLVRFADGHEVVALHFAVRRRSAKDLDSA